MAEILELFNYAFVLRALAVGLLVSLCAALLGVILVLKHFSLIGHGLGEVGFAAIALAVALGLSPLAVALPAVIVAAMFIMWLSQREDMSGDIAIGVISTAALSFGVIVTALSKGFSVDIYNYMFGSILAMTETDALLSAVLSVFVILVFALLFNRLYLVTYDETFARAAGVRVALYNFIISLLTAVTVVIGMRMMGTMLISSLIIFPAMTARNLVKSFNSMVFCAAVISVICFIMGLILSFMLDLPTGASVVAVDAGCLIVSIALKKALRK